MLTILLITVFSLGYSGIIFEKFLGANKAAIALLTGGICWWLYFLSNPDAASSTLFFEQLSSIAQIVFFLLTVMTIVEVMDSHDGFRFITDLLHTSSYRKLLWVLLVISFFMSAIIDNLTTMIVMVSLLKKLIDDRQQRWLIGSILVISINAGGAWTPIGDVTTTMLWIKERITSWEIIKGLFFPSVVCALIAGILGTFLIQKNQTLKFAERHSVVPGAKRILFAGTTLLVLIPVWKALFNLPPFMGALISLGILWLLVDLIHVKKEKNRTKLQVAEILRKIDTSTIFFFLGILLAVDALTAAGILQAFAIWLGTVIPSQTGITVIIGLISSIFGNVPVVAATMGMYDLTQFPVDAPFWQLVAYAAGTGGSIFIIGTAAGVTFMGLEKVDFFWYCKHIAWIALISYFAGIVTYIIQ